MAQLVRGVHLFSPRLYFSNTWFLPTLMFTLSFYLFIFFFKKEYETTKELFSQISIMKGQMLKFTGWAGVRTRFLDQSNYYTICFALISTVHNQLIYILGFFCSGPILLSLVVSRKHKALSHKKKTETFKVFDRNTCLAKSNYVKEHGYLFSI